MWLSLLLSAFANFRNELILMRRHKLNGATVKMLEDGYLSSEYYRQLLDVGSAAHSKSNRSVGGLRSENRDDFYDGGGESLWGPDGGRTRKRTCMTLFGHAEMSCAWNIVVIVCVVVAAGLFYVFEFIPIMERSLVGSTAYLVNLLNNETNSEQHNYTLWETALDILDGSGTNPFLQKDLVIFCIVGPCSCLLFSLVAAAVPLPKNLSYAAAKLAALGFSFSGMEVLAFAMYLASIILPVQSGALIEADGQVPFSACQAFDHLYV